jgi:hypothetical protein
MPVTRSSGMGATLTCGRRCRAVFSFDALSRPIYSRQPHHLLSQLSLCNTRLWWPWYDFTTVFLHRLWCYIHCEIIQYLSTDLSCPTLPLQKVEATRQRNRRQLSRSTRQNWSRSNRLHDISRQLQLHIGLEAPVGHAICRMYSGRWCTIDWGFSKSKRLIVTAVESHSNAWPYL